jgi:hypothetical protein
MMTPCFARVPGRHLQEKCAQITNLAPSLCLHLFFSMTNIFLHVWLSSKSAWL